MFCWIYLQLFIFCNSLQWISTKERFQAFFSDDEDKVTSGPIISVAKKLKVTQGGSASPDEVNASCCSVARTKNWTWTIVRAKCSISTTRLSCWALTKRTPLATTTTTKLKETLTTDRSVRVSQFAFRGHIFTYSYTNQYLADSVSLLKKFALNKNKFMGTFFICPNKKCMFFGRSKNFKKIFLMNKKMGNTLKLWGPIVGSFKQTRQFDYTKHSPEHQTIV